jgi:3-carboxy-cis,cis-muconate cycloisomerase
MRTNLDISNGLIMAEAVQMALGEKLGRMQAHDLLETASRRAAGERRHLREVIGEIPEIADMLSPARRDALFEPSSYLGNARDFIDAALQSLERALEKKSQAKGKRR